MPVIIAIRLSDQSLPDFDCNSNNNGDDYVYRCCTSSVKIIRLERDYMASSIAAIDNSSFYVSLFLLNEKCEMGSAKKNFDVIRLIDLHNPTKHLSVIDDNFIERVVEEYKKSHTESDSFDFVKVNRAGIVKSQLRKSRQEFGLCSGNDQNKRQKVIDCDGDDDDDSDNDGDGEDDEKQ